jgi:hypothetical protein
MPMSYDQLKARYKAQILYHVNNCRVTYKVTCILKATFHLQIHSEHKQTVYSVLF